MQNRKVKSCNDDVRKSAQATRWQCGTYGNQAIAVHLRIGKCVSDVFDTECAVLHACLIGAYTLDHKFFVCFAKTFGAHGGVRHPDYDEDTPEKGKTGVGDEYRLPGFQGAGFEEGEAVSEESADDLLSALFWSSSLALSGVGTSRGEV